MARHNRPAARIWKEEETLAYELKNPVVAAHRSCPAAGHHGREDSV